MKDSAEWIALSYSVPASPSKARVFVWRRLRALGAVTLRPGLAALPNSSEGKRSFALLAGKIRELGGEPLVLEMDLVDETESERLRARFADAGRRALREAMEEVAPILEKLETAEPAERTRLERSLNKKLGRLQKQSGNPLRDQMAEFEQTAGSLFEALRGIPAEFSAMLRGGDQGGNGE